MKKAISQLTGFFKITVKYKFWVMTNIRKEPIMAGFNFSKFNKERLFDIDTSDFEYTNLEELYNANGANFVYELRGVYIGTKFPRLSRCLRISLLSVKSTREMPDLSSSHSIRRDSRRPATLLVGEIFPSSSQRLLKRKDLLISQLISFSSHNQRVGVL